MTVKFGNEVSNRYRPARICLYCQSRIQAKKEKLIERQRDEVDFLANSIIFAFKNSHVKLEKNSTCV